MAWLIRNTAVYTVRTRSLPCFSCSTLWRPRLTPFSLSRSSEDDLPGQRPGRQAPSLPKRHAGAPVTMEPNKKNSHSDEIRFLPPCHPSLREPNTDEINHLQQQCETSYWTAYNTNPNPIRFTRPHRSSASGERVAIETFRFDGKEDQIRIFSGNGISRQSPH